MRRLLLIHALLSLLIPFTAIAAPKFSTISEEESIIEFNPAGIRFDQKTFLHNPFKNSGYESQSYVGLWKNSANPKREAFIIFTQLAAGFVYISKSALKDQLPNLMRTDKGNLTFQQKKFALSKFGGGDVQLFRQGDKFCVGFQQVGGEMSGFDMYVEGTEWLVGYYCQSPGKLSMEQGENIAKSIAVRSQNEPKPAP